jgi:hypothetical protein
MDLSKLPKLSETQQAEKDRAAEASAAPNTAPRACPHCGSAMAISDRFCARCGRTPVDLPEYDTPHQGQSGFGFETMFATLLGVIYMVLGWNFARYLMATFSGQTFNTGYTWQTGPKSGQPVEYWDLQGFTALSEASMFTFGLAMVVEAIVLAILVSRPRAIALAGVFVSLLITLVAVALNLMASVRLLNAGITPLFSIVATLVGGYMAYYQWAVAQRVRRRP